MVDKPYEGLFIEERRVRGEVESFTTKNVQDALNELDISFRYNSKHSLENGGGTETQKMEEPF